MSWRVSSLVFGAIEGKDGIAGLRVEYLDIQGVGVFSSY